LTKIDIITRPITIKVKGQPFDANEHE